MSHSSQHSRKGSVVNASCRVSLLAAPSHLMPPNRAWDAVMERLAKDAEQIQIQDNAGRQQSEPSEQRPDQPLQRS